MAEEKWYFDPSTGDVDLGKEGSWANRMGPYDSEAEAHDALKLAHERNKQADAQDEEDDNWGQGS